MTISTVILIAYANNRMLAKDIGSMSQSRALFMKRIGNILVKPVKLIPVYQLLYSILNNKAILGDMLPKSIINEK